ncbi:Flp pilus assembly complex ATPase component TadA [Candidatus Woesearchaeota archaeon]|nr:Flp pilus assembly complex ATPase component TadA [Candidatus Woesearchaeota archaeon]
MPPKKTLIVPDTSVLIEGLLSKALKAGKLKNPVIMIHEASIAELEHQANQSQEKGYLGLDEIGALQALAAKKKLVLEFRGERPGEWDIAEAKRGAIDSLIRELAFTEGATLYTADKVQATVADAKGVPVEFHEMVAEGEMDIEEFFKPDTMSVHIKENCLIRSKRGQPGAWTFDTVTKKKVTREDVERYAKQIVETAQVRRDGFVEIERAGSTICQVGKYRIVITRPPFSDGYEITAVRPVKHLTLDDYDMSDKLSERLDAHAEGLLIAGAPGHGKSTFAQALAEHYAKQQKIIKTVEAPRDLILADDITQYAMSHGSAEEIHDILLLSRPDYTIFDEMRNTDDFALFADMRLSGVGMIGVMHATKAIEAIQRFLGRIELGVIPHVVDTVIFIKDGAIGSVFSIRMTVKVPSGMTEADLARPIVEVHDFQSGTLVFELYTYGEQTVVIPVSAQVTKESPVNKFIAKGVKEYFQNWTDNVEVEMQSATKATVYVPNELIPELIGRGGENIRELEKKLGVGIDLKELPGHDNSYKKKKKGRENKGKSNWKGKAKKGKRRR